MSALPPKADIRARDQDVSFGPIADIHPFIWILSKPGIDRYDLDEIFAVFAGPLAISVRCSLQWLSKVFASSISRFWSRSSHPFYRQQQPMKRAL
jgi:hypothetical protein